MRAAAALKSAAVHLMTAVDAQTADAAKLAAAALSIGRTVSERDQPVRFRYFTPVSNPSIDGPTAQFSTPLSAEDSSVLVFGMIERGPVTVSAPHLVLDPNDRAI